MSFSWGSSNNNNNNNNNSSNGFSNTWGSSNNNQSSTNNQPSNNSSLNWNNNNNNSTNTQNNNTNNNSNSWGSSWGNNKNNNTKNNNNTNNNNTNPSTNNGWNNNSSATFNLNTNSNNNSWNTNNNSSVLNPNNDYVIPNTPCGAISCVKFHPTKPQFIVSSWDNSISYYEFFGNNQNKKCGEQKHDKPILTCCFDANGDNVFSAGCDNVIKVWNPSQNQFATLGAHTAPIRCVEHNAGANFVISGSWDKQIAFWDPRSPGNNKPIHSVNTGHKIYAMASKDNALVVGLSNNDIKTYDLRNRASEIHSVQSETRGSSSTKAVSLKKQIRSIDIFPDSTGYVAASIGGRVIIRHFDRNNKASNDFSYKCHRQSIRNGSNIFAVNVIKFHQQSAVFATGGDDGEVVTWDKDGRAKLYSFKPMSISNYRNNSGNNNQNIDNSRMPIVALDYHSNGKFMIYATSYNWNKGQEFNDTAQQKPQVYLHQVTQKEWDKSKKK